MTHKDIQQRNEYSREYMARRYRDRRAFAYATLGGCCAACGAVENLEIDHIDRSTKTATVAKIMVGARWQFEAELAKCQLLCHDCHLLKTREELSVPHGGGKKGRGRCSCGLCRAAQTVYQQARRGNGARKPVTCGTSNSYRRGCRCNACRAVNAKNARELRASKRAAARTPVAE